jgi:uncharacterized protein (TIGR03435 family)
LLSQAAIRKTSFEQNPKTDRIHLHTGGICIVRSLLLLICCLAAAFAQPATLPSFEVASIRASQQDGDAIEVTPGALTMHNISLAGCVQWAYGIQEYQFSGPGWLNQARFDISAKAPHRPDSEAPAKEAQLRLMLQRLLDERFKLAIHRESKELEVMVLTVGKNPHKLQPVDTEGSPSFTTGNMSLIGHGATIRQMTDFLSRAVRFPMVDETGLTGRFNYTLDISAYVTEEMRKSQGPPAEATGIIAQAIQTQLGLKVTSKKMPVEIIVVDHAEKTPVEN